LLFLSALGKETGILFWVALGGYFALYKKEYLISYLRLFTVLLGVYVVMRYGVAGVGMGHNKLSPIMLASVEERLLSLPKIICYYLQLMIFPLSLAISQHWVVQTASWHDFYWPLIVVLSAGTVWLAVLFSQFLKREGWRNLVFFTLFFVLGLGLHSQIVALDLTVSERWLYLPLFAFLGFVLLLFQQQKKATYIFLALSLLLIVFAARTVVRTLDWRDGLTLFVRDEPRARGNFDFENNLGVYYYRAGKPQLAERHYRRSTEIAPHWWTNWNNLGVVYQGKGKLKLAEQAYLKSIKNGDYYLAYENYAGLLIQQKKFPQLRQFLDNEALPKFPYNSRMREISEYLKQQNAH
jgi:tetratricopeptide (TPR) repeat protein